MPRYLSADYIFDGAKMHRNSVLVLNEEGQVISLSSEEEQGETPEFFKGILCPGFINSHCHLELSHLKGKIEKGKTLPGFIKEVVPKRLASGSEIDAAIVAAEKEMLDDGIVAVGDICNSEATFPRKAVSELVYHSFMEVFSPDPAKAHDMLNLGKTLQSRMKQMYPQSGSSITPHAPYSVSDSLFKLINESCYVDDGLISIHNQETVSEDEMFVSASGTMYELMNAFGNGIPHFRASGFRSLPSTIVKLPRCSNVLLVHNTFTNSDDIERALKYTPRIWFCLCPKANLYIENRLPDVNIFTSYSDKIVVGTDSLASNDTLSVLEELKTLKEHFPQLKTQMLLQWATSNAADFFGWKELGTFKAGAYPGVNHISTDEEGEISASSKVKRVG